MVVLCRGQYAHVLDVVVHAPNTHPQSPIKNEMWAHEIVTERGSRWNGYEGDPK